jgi:hypothetical protein
MALRRLGTLVFLWGALAAKVQAESLALDVGCLIDSANVKAAPRFADFPSKPSGLRPAAPLIKTSGDRLFRTQLRRQATHGPNFAGIFTIASWGCGTACLSFAIINAQTGQVFGNGFAGILATDHAKNFEGLHFRRNSRLLILTGTPEDDLKREGVYYALWTGKRLKVIRFVSRADLCSREIH